MASSKLPDGDLAFNYFPGNYRWCHGLLIALSGAPWGGAEIDEVNRIGLRLKGKAPDDDAAWFNEWSGEAERIEAIGHAEAARGYALTAAGYLRRAAHYYQVGERFVHPKTEASQAAYQRAVDCFKKAASLMTHPKIEHVEVPYEGTSLPGILVHADPRPGRSGAAPRGAATRFNRSSATDRTPSFRHTREAREAPREREPSWHHDRVGRFVVIDKDSGRPSRLALAGRPSREIVAGTGLMIQV